VGLADLLTTADILVIYATGKELHPIVALQILDGMQFLRAGEELSKLRKCPHPVVELRDERIQSRRHPLAVDANPLQIGIGEPVLRR